MEHCQSTSQKPYRCGTADFDGTLWNSNIGKAVKIPLPVCSIALDRNALVFPVHELVPPKPWGARDFLAQPKQTYLTSTGLVPCGVSLGGSIYPDLSQLWASWGGCVLEADPERLAHMACYLGPGWPYQQTAVLDPKSFQGCRDVYPSVQSTLVQNVQIGW